MATNYTVFSITAPGFMGLNTQDAPVDMDSKYALEAINCVIDKYGRVGSRKGWEPAHTTAAALSTANVESIGQLVAVDGSRTMVCAGNNKLFKLVGTTLTELTYGGGSVAPVITTNKWQTCCMNDAVIFWQEGYDPLVYDIGLSTTQYRRVSEHASYSGSVPKADCAISAYGRVWAANSDTNKQVVYWSDLLTYQKWTAGTSGSLDLRGVWPQGGDEIVALAAHNNSLIIFGKRQILIYTGADTPATMALSDAIGNCGCVGRDTVQNTPSDVIFLSDGGVRAIARTIQEKSAPLTVVSRTVNDDILQFITAEGATDTIKAIYSPLDQFYLLTFTNSVITYCFDMRQQMQDGSNRVTQWSSNVPKSYFYDSSSRTLHMGQAGYMGTYSSYLDNGSNYRMSYYSSWLDFGDPIKTSILKKISSVVFGAASQSIVYKWGFDYVQGSRSTTETLESQPIVAYYNIAEYGIAEYNTSQILATINSNCGGVGRVMQLGIEVLIVGLPISIQKMIIYTKDGAYK